MSRTGSLHVTLGLRAMALLIACGPGLSPMGAAQSPPPVAPVGWTEKPRFFCHQGAPGAVVWGESFGACLQRCAADATCIQFAFYAARRGCAIEADCPTPQAAQHWATYTKDTAVNLTYRCDHTALACKGYPAGTQRVVNQR